jgi:hypothetical protein
MERIRARKGHSPTEEHRQMEILGHRKNWSQQEALTNWRAHIDEQVKNERTQASKGYSQSRVYRQTI